MRAEMFLRRFRGLDYTLIGALAALTAVSGVTLYSAGGQDVGLVLRQGLRFGLGFVALFALAQVPVAAYRKWGPLLYLIGVLFLLLVLFIGDVSKGAQRWLDLWVIKFQPSELLKIGVPMALCWLFASGVSRTDAAVTEAGGKDGKVRPPAWKFIAALALLAVPAVIVALQPDFGTAVLIAMSGVFVVFLVGIPWLWIGLGAVAALALAPVVWHSLLDYQRQRLLVFLDPESDPLGAGYHIIQSKIAIGSGGLWGKGWLQGSQSQLDFIPERATDFVFAVFSEEFGFAGICVLVSLYLLIMYRGFKISMNAADEFGRLLAGALILSFFLSFFVNVGMVSGLLPVVGVPLPLVSYGGTSVVTLLASFGVLMAIARYRPMMRNVPL